jgi:hypothetical protein
MCSCACRPAFSTARGLENTKRLRLYGREINTVIGSCVYELETYGSNDGGSPSPLERV